MIPQISTFGNISDENRRVALSAPVQPIMVFKLECYNLSDYARNLSKYADPTERSQKVSAMYELVYPDIGPLPEFIYGTQST